MKKLKQRWGVTSNFQLTVIFIVFAITGSSAAYLSKPFIELIGISKDSMPAWIHIPLRLLVIFPVYQILLVFFGFIFGQFKFFWAFEKKMLKSMKLGFLFENSKKN